MLDQSATRLAAAAAPSLCAWRRHHRARCGCDARGQAQCALSCASSDAFERRALAALTLCIGAIMQCGSAATPLRSSRLQRCSARQTVGHAIEEGRIRHNARTHSHRHAANGIRLSAHSPSAHRTHRTPALVRASQHHFSHNEQQQQQQRQRSSGPGPTDGRGDQARGGVEGRSRERIRGRVSGLRRRGRWAKCG